MTAVLTATVGLPGSGKTTWARAQVDSAPLGTVARLNRDDVRRMALPSDYRAPRAAGERLVTAARDAVLLAWLSRGVDVICDDTNLVPDRLRQLAHVARAAGARLAVVRFDTPIEVCIARDARREGAARVGAAVIRDMAVRAGWLQEANGQVGDGGQE